MGPYQGPHRLGQSADPQRGPAVSEGYIKDEYIFSKAEQGRVFRSDAALVPLVHLEADVLAFLAARAETRGILLNEIVDTLLRKSMELSKLPNSF